MIKIYTCISFFLYYREMPVIRVPLVPRGLRAAQELQVWPDPKETGAIEETPVWWVSKAKKEKWAPKVSICNVFFFNLLYDCIVRCSKKWLKNKTHHFNKGYTGLMGQKGEPGLMGIPGSNGSPGIMGRKGETGTQGMPGAKGEMGQRVRELTTDCCHTMND